jgi:hypothetical protein
MDDTSPNITFDHNWQIGQGLTSYYYNNTFRCVSLISGDLYSDADIRTTNALNAKATIDFYGPTSPSKRLFCMLTRSRKRDRALWRRICGPRQLQRLS